jgi:hemoglobin
VTQEIPISANPRRKPLHDGIDEAMIRALVDAFYARIRADVVLGPVFAEIIAAEWGPHLAKMVDFWSSVMLMSGRYHGNPMAVHQRLDMVIPEHFTRWLALFHQTAREVCPADIAALFSERAETIARSLQVGMFWQPGDPKP